MKKIVSLFIFIGLIVVNSACSSNHSLEDSTKETNKTAEIPSDIQYVDNSELVNTVSYNSFEDLEKNADLIVIAQALKPFEEREHQEIYQDIPEDNSKLLIDGYTETEILIKKVLKQPETENKTAGDTMFVQEPAFIFTEDNVKKIRTVDYYRPINDKDDYLLFFNKSGWNDGSYTSMNWNNGKFSLQQTDELKHVLSKSNSLDQEVLHKQIVEHQAMRKITFETYANEINEVLK